MRATTPRVSTGMRRRAESSARASQGYGTGDRRQQQFAFGIVVVDSGLLDGARELEAKTVTAFDVVERRDVKAFFGAEFLAVHQRVAATMQEVAVRATKGVVDFPPRNGDQLAVAVMLNTRN